MEDFKAQEVNQINFIISPTLPVLLSLYPDGTISLSYNDTSGCSALFDHKPSGIGALFDPEGFSLWEGDKFEDRLDYHYNWPYKYKEMPLLKQWLVQQDMWLA
jgi:hypothetical protein